jgi:L,D-transpeptidase catalytic domain
MSRHRAEPPRRRPPAPPHRHAATQPRYGRIGAVAVSATVCAVALLGGFGVLPSVANDAADSDVARDLTGRSGLAAVGDSAVLVLDSAQNDGDGSQGQADQTTKPAKTDQSDQTDQTDQTDQPASSDGADPAPGSGVTPGESAESDRPVDASADESLPADSGEGYRVVFSEARQRVWLVDSDGAVERTYPVSGSLYDNLDPGTYEVYSRSEQAYAFDGSGSMKYFVRFAQGDTGAAIGFHDIPVGNTGDLVQSLDQLGTPQSHGCIRQEQDDAIALWDFAPEGTEVVVV